MESDLKWGFSAKKIVKLKKKVYTVEKKQNPLILNYLVKNLLISYNIKFNDFNCLNIYQLLLKTN